MENTWKTGCLLEKAAFDDIILHATSDTEAAMETGEIWFDAANDVYKGKNSQEVIQFAIQSDVDALEGRMDTAETNITDLQGRVTTAEGEIDTLQNDMATAQGDITDLQGRMTTAEGEIDTLHSDLTTLTDRVAVQTDTDGHGKLSYLKEQTIEPTPGTDEGVIYTADDGGDTCLYYKANGEVVELGRPDYSTVPNVISNMRVSRVDNQNILINAGSRIPINGVIYSVDSDITFDVDTYVGGLTADTWYWIAASAPASGRTLTASDIAATTSAAVWYGNHGYWSWNGDADTKRIIFPVCTDENGLLAYFGICQGRFIIANPSTLRFIDTTNPPTVSTVAAASLPNAEGHRYLTTIVGTLAANGSGEASMRIGSFEGGMSAQEVYAIRTSFTNPVTTQVDVLTNTSRQIRYQCNSYVGTASLSVVAFDLPEAMM